MDRIQGLATIFWVAVALCTAALLAGIAFEATAGAEAQQADAPCPDPCAFDAGPTHSLNAAFAAFAAKVLFFLAAAFGATAITAGTLHRRARDR